MATDSYFGSVGSVTLTTTTETIIATSSVIHTGDQHGSAIISGYLNITAGTGTTAVQIRIRQGATLAGPLVGVADTHTLAAGASASIPYGNEDTSGYVQTVYGGQYCVTVQQVGATANGSVNDGTLKVEIPL